MERIGHTFVYVISVFTGSDRGCHQAGYSGMQSSDNTFLGRGGVEWEGGWHNPEASVSGKPLVLFCY